MLVSLTVSNKTFQWHNVNNRRSVTLAAGNPKCDVSPFLGQLQKEPNMMILPVVAPLKLALGISLLKGQVSLAFKAGVDQAPAKGQGKRES